MWVELKGFRYSYRINEEGTVQGLVRGVWKDKKQRVHGTSIINLYTEGKKDPDTYTVGSLMAQAFMGGCPENCIVVHKNGLKTDNRLCNLEIVEKHNGRSGGGTRKVVSVYDMKGNLVTIYPSIKEAALREHISEWTLRMNANDNSGAVVPKTKHRYVKGEPLDEG